MLFSPFHLRSIMLGNRLAVSPMCQYSSHDGFANDWHLVHLGSRAVGGAGLVMTEAAAVSAEGRITPHDLGIWKDEHIEFLSRITSFIRAQKSVAAIQLAHAGRKASHHRPWDGGHALLAEEGAWQTYAPSPLAFKQGEPHPKALSSTEIDNIIDQFRNAAARALEAGFSIVEIHAAHGYLIHEFLSPLSNQRQDLYGGSFDNRIRLLLNITRAIRSIWPDSHPLFVRISATDWIEGGWTIDESLELARILKREAVDLVDCSSGGNVTGVSIPAAPLYQAGFADRIRKETGMPTGAVGLITTAAEAQYLLETGAADLIFLGRQFLRDPYFPLHAAEELEQDIAWPEPYLRAKSR
ncbi:MAG TPA: NADH:flavin oxidoreductase/NADH oxidase [Flavisolibacter sp.]|nr:NADH:flavin oxidoreductase/NADH oxidase [Flavisolibacter sp.]